MEQYHSSSRANEIGAFVETIRDTKDLHLLLSLSLRKWVKSLKHGIPNGYEKFQLWLDIRGDSEGNDSVVPSHQEESSDRHVQQTVQVQNPQQSAPAQPLVTIKQERIEFTPVELNSSAPAAMDVPLSFNVPPDSHKRKVPPCEPFMSPSVNKLSRRSNSPTDSDYFQDTSCASAVETNVSSAVSGSSRKPRGVALPPPGSPHSSSSESSSESGSDSDTSSNSGSSSGLSENEGGRSTSPAPSRSKWTPEQDELLRETVRQHKAEGWRVIAHVVGRKAAQCKKRWSEVLQFNAGGGMVRWSPAELKLLQELVQEHTRPPRWSTKNQAMAKPLVDWITVGTKLARTPSVCSKRWHKLKKALPTAVTDSNAPALGDESSSESSSESGSEPELVLQEGNTSNTERLTQCETPSSRGRSLWTQEQDERLREGVALHRAEGWKRVAEFVGDDKTHAQCQVRWSVYGSRSDDALAKSAPWSEADVERLRNLVQKHKVPSHWSKRMKSMTRELIDWIAIEKEMGRRAHHCRNKWKHVKHNPGVASALHTHVEDECAASSGSSSGGSDVESVPRSFGRETPASSHRARWTTVQDARLQEGVRLHRASGWKAVAEFVGDGMTLEKCRTRWHSALSHQENGVAKTGAWSDEEVARLVVLVSQHTIAPYWSQNYKVMTRERIAWSVIGKELSRVPLDCRDKWRQRAKLSSAEAGANASDVSGSTSASSDEGSTGSDSSGESCVESGEEEEVAVSSATTQLSALADGTSTKRVRWTPEEDERLREGVKLYKESGGWQRVAEHVGGDRTRRQCSKRYCDSVRYVEEGASKDTVWSDAEVKMLPELVRRHTIAPYWSDNYKVMTQERIDWKAVSEEMGKPPRDCRDKLDTLVAADLKKGPFTEDEDILIIHSVKEWGDKGKGLWVNLQRDLGRPRSVIRKRWTDILCKRVQGIKV